MLLKVDSAPHSVVGTVLLATTSLAGLECPLLAVLAVWHKQFHQMEMHQLMLQSALLPMSLPKLSLIPLWMVIVIALVNPLVEVAMLLKMGTSVLGTSLTLQNWEVELSTTLLLVERPTWSRQTGTWPQRPAQCPKCLTCRPLWFLWWFKFYCVYQYLIKTKIHGPLFQFVLISRITPFFPEEFV